MVWGLVMVMAMWARVGSSNYAMDCLLNMDWLAGDQVCWVHASAGSNHDITRQESLDGSVLLFLHYKQWTR